MKHLQSFNEFLNEASVFSPKNIKEYKFDKNSIKEIKNWSYNINDLTLKYKNFENYVDDLSYFMEFLEGKSDRNSIYHRITINNVDFIIQLNVNNSTTFDDEQVAKYKYLSFTVDKNTMSTYILNANDKLKGYNDLVNFLVSKFEQRIYDAASELLGIKVLYVIKAGDISPATGKTGHGWSIFDSPNCNLYYDKKTNNVLYGQLDIKIGDKFKILDDQSHKELYHIFTISEIVPCNYKSFVAFSAKHGAKIPIGSYQKQPGSFNFVLLSIK